MKQSDRKGDIEAFFSSEGREIRRQVSIRN
jgi:hypothetical protein